MGSPSDSPATCDSSYTGTTDPQSGTEEKAIADHKNLVAAKKKEIEAATQAINAKKESVENTVYILALKKAIAALEKGMGGAFLQTGAATVLKRLLRSDSQIMGNLMDADRQDLTAFLDAPAYGNEYVPQSQEVVGILN